MPPKKRANKAFNVVGPHATSIISTHLLPQAKAAISDGLKACEADFSWPIFLAQKPDLVTAIATDHPGTAKDSTVCVRENYGRQVTKFIKWLTSPGGGGIYPRTFADQCGLIASGLAGSCAPPDSQVPGSDATPQAEEAKEAEEEEETGAPLADDNKKPAAKKTPPPKATKLEEDIDGLTDAFKDWKIHEGKTMKVKYCLIPDVHVIGDPVGTRDVLVAQICAPPGGILKECVIRPRASQPNTVDVKIPIDPKFSNGEALVRPKWRELNPTLATSIAGGLGTYSSEQLKEGANHEEDKETFEWPNGVESTLNFIDPYCIGLRRRPSGPTQPLVEVQPVKLDTPDGKVVPCYQLTFFFLVARARHFRDMGDVTLNGSGDDDSPRGRRGRRSNKRGRRADSSFDSMDEGTDNESSGGGGGGGAAAKKSPPFALAAAYSVGLLGLVRLAMAGTGAYY